MNSINGEKQIDLFCHIYLTEYTTYISYFNAL